MLTDPTTPIHMIAICGTAMGSLAAMLRERGYRITGSDDHVYPPMSTWLRQAGIRIQEGFAAENLGSCGLVIVGNAVSRGNPEVEAMLERRIPYLSLPQVLRDEFLRSRTPVVVSGTHGKTTTTALVAHLLERGGLDPSFLVAGVVRDGNTSYHLGQGEHFVIEGDEYDSAYFFKIPKFLFYLPQVVVINNIEFDHADIYRDLYEIERAFRQLVNLVPRSGLIVANGEDPVVRSVLDGAFSSVLTFGVDCQVEVDLRASRVTTDRRGTHFDVELRGTSLGSFTVPLHGLYNVRNCLAALGVALHSGLQTDSLRGSLAEFRGVRRRQEYLGVVGGVIVIDDFAHHPTAVQETLKGLRQAHPDARIIAVFEPASASNTRSVFEDRYVDAFRGAQYVIIGRVPRPERARGDPPFDPERVASALRSVGTESVHIPDISIISATLASLVHSGDVIVIMSNGAFGGLAGMLMATLEKRFGVE